MVSSDMGHPEEIKEDSSRQRGASSGWGRGRLDDQGAWPAQDGGVAGPGTRERGRLGLGSKAGKRPRGLLQFPTVPRFKGVVAFDRSP